MTTLRNTLASGERHRALRFVSWMVLLVAVVLTLGQIYLSILNAAVDKPGAAAGVVASALLEILVLGFIALGLLVVYRRLRNPIGWIITGTGLIGLASDLVESYGVCALNTDPGALPGGEVMAWLSNWIFIPVIFAAPAMLFLLFPNGNLLSRHWRPVFWIVILTNCAAMTTSILQPVLNDPPFEGVVNPFFSDPSPQALGAILSIIGWPGMAASFLVAAFAMILRLRRSRGEERQQLKWIATAAAILPLASAAGIVSYYLGYKLVAGIAASYSIFPIFLVAGYAILRYRLYDIDIIINRTLVYGSLTVSLALVYFGGVTATQALFQTLTGHQRLPQLAVVVSTLVIAALFNPLRRIIQEFIDRLFYRKKYDAAKTLADFSTKLRDETDLDNLSTEMVFVVTETMQPEHVSLWLVEEKRKE